MEEQWPVMSDLNAVIRNEATYEAFRAELLRQPIEHEDDAVFLASLKQRNYTLPLSLSACHGYYGYQFATQNMAEYAEKRPFYVLIGPRYRIATKELLNGRFRDTVRAREPPAQITGNLE